MSKVNPLGAKIAELRRSKGIKQAAFAAEIGVSERTLRSIEKDNLPIEAFRLEEIAGKLKTEMTALMAPTSKPTRGDEKEIELRAVVTATALFKIVGWSTVFEWDTEVEPTGKLLHLMETVLGIAKYKVENSFLGHGSPDDAYSLHEFADLHRTAALNDALDALKANGVHVLANEYTSKNYKHEDEYVIVMRFAPTGTNSLRVKRRWEPPLSSRETAAPDGGSVPL